MPRGLVLKQDGGLTLIPVKLQRVLGYQAVTLVLTTTYCSQTP